MLAESRPLAIKKKLREERGKRSKAATELRRECSELCGNKMEIYEKTRWNALRRGEKEESFEKFFGKGRKGTTPQLERRSS